MFNEKFEIDNREYVKVVGYGLDDFVKGIEEAVQAGYKVDWESNEFYPMTIGHVHSAGLFKEKEQTKPAGRAKKAE